MAAAQLYQRKWVLIKLPIALVAVALMAWLWTAWLPMPEARLVLSAGQRDGVYHAHALRYAQRLAEHGVQVEVLESDGAVQNLQRLLGAAQPRADLAFVQSGVTLPDLPGGALQTLARVDVEPLWIFSRVPGIDSLTQLQGLRLSLGAAGSGTRQLALAMLEQVRLRPRDYVDSPLAGTAAAEAMRRGELDVMFTVVAPESPVVRRLLATPGVQLVELRRTAAITERVPFLQVRLLPQGALDARGTVPARDTTVLTTPASLVAREDLAPALQRLATHVATELHRGPGVFHRAGEFPSLKRLPFPPSDAARQTLVHGLPWLESNLPFWWAQVLQRVLVICLPVALLAFWLARLVPAYLRWLMESRIARWYGELKYIEHDLSRETVSGLDLTRYLDRLNNIERRMTATTTPAYLMPRWYTLRQHIDFVRMGLFRRRGR